MSDPDTGHDAEPDDDNEPEQTEATPERHDNGERIDSPTPNATVVGVTIVDEGTQETPAQQPAPEPEQSADEG